MNINPQIGGAVRDVRGSVLETSKALTGAISTTGRILSDSSSFTKDIINERLTNVGIGAGVAKIASMGTGTITSTTNMLKPATKYNTFYKVIVLVLFFTVFLKVIINIFRFFGIDIIDLYSYMGWVIFLLIVLIFIPHDYSTLKLN